MRVTEGANSPLIFFLIECSFENELNVEPVRIISGLRQPPKLFPDYNKLNCSFPGKNEL